MLIYSSLGFFFKQKYRLQMNSTERKEKKETLNKRTQTKFIILELESIILRQVAVFSFLVSASAFQLHSLCAKLKVLEGQRVTITSNNWYFKYVRNTMRAGRKPLTTDKEAKFVFSDL